MNCVPQSYIPPTNAFQSLVNTTAALENNPEINQGVMSGITQNNFDSLMTIFLGMLSLVILFIYGPLRKKIILDKYNDIYSRETGNHLLNLRHLFFSLLTVL